jgi:acyl-CoA hydrolase
MGGTAMAKHATPITPQQAAALVQSGMWLDFGACLGQPDVFDQALAARAGELDGVKIRSCLSMRPRAFQTADPEGHHILNLSWHFTGHDRRQHDAGNCSYIPLNLGEWPDLYRRFITPPDIAIIKCCPKDANGFYNFSAAATYLRALVERAKVLIVEVSEGLPYCLGPASEPRDTGVHESDVDFIIQGDHAAAPELPNPPITEIDRRIAHLIAAEVSDGACLQIGIGGMPNAVCMGLKDAGLRDLGIATEMMVDGIMALMQAGMVTGARKQVDPGKATYTFGAGSRALYAFMDRNPALEIRSVDHTNLPQNVARNDNVIAVNSTGQMDLQGQAASESAGHRHFTGTGGQLGFVRGAYQSRGGKAFLCMPSTYDKDKSGVRKSRVVVDLPPGTVVTTPRTDTMYVATEYGLVNLKGKSVPERALAMISIAHPDFREGLEREAREKGIVPRGWR